MLPVLRKYSAYLIRRIVLRIPTVLPRFPNGQNFLQNAEKGWEDTVPQPFSRNDRNSLCRQDHLVGFVDHRVALNGAEEQVLIVIPGSADGLGVGGEVADSVDKTIPIPADMGEVGSVEIPPLHIVQQTEVVFPLHLRHVLRDREELLHEFHDLLIRQLDFGQIINTAAQLAHVGLGQHQGLPGLMGTAH